MSIELTNENIFICVERYFNIFILLVVSGIQAAKDIHNNLSVIFNINKSNGWQFSRQTAVEPIKIFCLDVVIGVGKR
jgi:hypothetical protein